MWQDCTFFWKITELYIHGEGFCYVYILIQQIIYKKLYKREGSYGSKYLDSDFMSRS